MSSCRWHVWEGRRVFSGNTGFAVHDVPHPVSGPQECLEACQQLHMGPCDYFVLENVTDRENQNLTMCRVMNNRHDAPVVRAAWARTEEGRRRGRRAEAYDGESRP